MAREVTHTAAEPYKIDAADVDPEKGNVAICQCGLSAERPFCDGSHRNARDEEAGVRYTSEDDDDENPRHEIERIVFADG